MCMCGHLVLQDKFLAIDLEWKPDYNARQNHKVAMMQVRLRGACILFRRPPHAPAAAAATAAGQLAPRESAAAAATLVPAASCVAGLRYGLARTPTPACSLFLWCPRRLLPAQIASSTCCVLLHTASFDSRLPEAARKLLADPNVALVGFAWDNGDERKLQTSFKLGKAGFGRFFDLEVRCLEWVVVCVVRVWVVVGGWGASGWDQGWVRALL